MHWYDTLIHWVAGNPENTWEPNLPYSPPQKHTFERLPHRSSGDLFNVQQAPNVVGSRACWQCRNQDAHHFVLHPENILLCAYLCVPVGDNLCLALCPWGIKLGFGRHSRVKSNQIIVLSCCQSMIKIILLRTPGEGKGRGGWAGKFCPIPSCSPVIYQNAAVQLPMLISRPILVISSSPS